MDIATLGIKYEKITYTSDYFPNLMEMAEKLIKKGKTCVDDTPKEQMRYEREKKIESKCRNQSVDENLKLWNEMVLGTEKGVQCCLRGKLDITDNNGSMRDPTYYRCNPIPHHRVGSKYKIYPTYDFACPFVDSIEGITHALRSSEYHDRNPHYSRIQEEIGVRKVHLYEFSRLNMVYTVLSKRKLLWFVEKNKVNGWDDACFPTVQGIVRRGLQIQALIHFILDQVILEENRVLLTLLDGPHKPFVRVIPKHKKYVAAGDKSIAFTKKIWIEQADAKAISPNEEITLMDWGNAIVREIKKDKNRNVTDLIGVLHPEGSFKTTKLKLTWLPHTNELVPLTLVEFGYLITKKKMKKEKDFIPVLNRDTKKEIGGVGDSNMRRLKCGDILQLERKGYFRCDVPFITPSKPIVLFAVPDSRQTATTK
ncbi:unnamed protein product [Lactuca saligna]|uniref:glutamate--tRNA ligase n=1 Tax=Lactuca saligna TaxID=75948 RepID=A0AA36E0U6_LACSI|nr:unnamed protein product [Lactuca saligna]